MKLHILKENGNLVLGRSDDDVRTLAEMLVLTSYSKIYAEQPLFLMVEMCRNAIQAGTYAMMYRWDKAAAENLVVPLGFFLWGMMNEPAEAIMLSRLRNLNPLELNSGPRWNVTTAMFPYSGYFKSALDMLFEGHPKLPRAGFTRVSDKEAKLHYMGNKYYKE